MEKDAANLETDFKLTIHTCPFLSLHLVEAGKVVLAEVVKVIRCPCKQRIYSVLQSQFGSFKLVAEVLQELVFRGTFLFYPMQSWESGKHCHLSCSRLQVSKLQGARAYRSRQRLQRQTAGKPCAQNSWPTTACRAQRSWW